MDFDGFGEPSWHPKSHKNRYQEASQKGSQKVSILDLIFGHLRAFRESLGAGGHGPAQKIRPPKVSLLQGKEEKVS